MEDAIIPYELPEVENHSFFFIDQQVEVNLEAKLHQHDAWELYYVVHGQGNRMAGDTLQPFTAGDVVLIPPSMIHRWEYNADSTDEEGHVRYLMVAFSHSLLERCIEVFPELRNRLSGVQFPTDALKFGLESSRIIRRILSEINEMDVSLLDIDSDTVLCRNIGRSADIPCRYIQLVPNRSVVLSAVRRDLSRIHADSNGFENYSSDSSQHV